MNYKNGTVTLDVNEFIVLDKTANQVASLRQKNTALCDMLLPRLFRKYSMSYSSREQMTEVKKDGTTGYDFGFVSDDVTELKAAGVTMDEMIAHINKQWDELEAEEAEEDAEDTDVE